MRELYKELRRLQRDLHNAEEWADVEAIEKRISQLLEKITPSAEEVERWNQPADVEKWNQEPADAARWRTPTERQNLRDVSPCTTDCARYRAGTCPFAPNEQREKCPRWRDLLRP